MLDLLIQEIDLNTYVAYGNEVSLSGDVEMEFRDNGRREKVLAWAEEDFTPCVRVLTKPTFFHRIQINQ